MNVHPLSSRKCSISFERSIALSGVTRPEALRTDEELPGNHGVPVLSGEVRNQKEEVGEG
jgi:hypothetical protein